MLGLVGPHVNILLKCELLATGNRCNPVFYQEK
jgi:hypothetical protein